jgi:prephenate dehydratase
LQNYNLLQKSNLHVEGEIYLRINQHLMANPGVKLGEIREVHSHPMAFLQCIDYLEANNWKLVETEDTALSAKLIHQHHHRHAAAIAGKFAAGLFQLNILTPNIHSLRNNVTRFLALRRTDSLRKIDNANKASIYFETDHSRGSLARVLGLAADGGMNLSKLQSFPIPGSDWKYFFHADMEFEDEALFHTIIEKIKLVTLQLKIYGIYKKGKKETA